MPVPERDHDLRDKEKIMADITSVFQTYNNSGSGVAKASDNFEQLTTKVNGLGARSIVVQIDKDSGDATEAQMVDVLQALCNAGGDGTGTDVGGPDAFTVAAFAQSTIGTDPAYAVLQGTGTLNTTPVTGYTVTVLATFDQA
jgi:hypothetical protein